jgi:hypothetical protein
VGVGISAFVLSLMVVIMIIPTINAYPSDSGYSPKQDIELERLILNYTSRTPENGGPYDEVLIDFQQIRLTEIKSLELGIVELDKVIIIKKEEAQVQKEVILHEQKLIAAAKEKMQKDWNALPHDTRYLEDAFEKLKTLNMALKQLVEQKRITIVNIDTKTILYDIQKHDAKLIGIELSANCIALAKLGSSACPTYEDLLSLDTSITKITGEFSFYDGYFHRERSSYTESFRAYDSDDKVRIIVDPPQNESIRMKMITIEPNLGYYADTGYATKLVDGKRILGNERVISNCYTSTISANNWKMLLPDTIFTFRNGCESAEINDTVEFNMPKTYMDPLTSPNMHYKHWVLEMKQLCKVKC